MNSGIPKKVTVSTTVSNNIKQVWKYWTEPEHITKWNQASDDWQTTFAENDVTAGGKFLYRMEAKDKSSGFDFSGTYDDVKPFKRLGYVLDDGRAVSVVFNASGDQTEIVETFEAENTFPVAQQKEGWQLILDHFKEYVEGASS